MCLCSHFILAHTQTHTYTHCSGTSRAKFLITGPALEKIAPLAREKEGLISVLWNPIAPAVIKSPDSSPASIHASGFLETQDHILLGEGMGD